MTLGLTLGAHRLVSTARQLMRAPPGLEPRGCPPVGGEAKTPGFQPTLPAEPDGKALLAVKEPFSQRWGGR